MLKTVLYWEEPSDLNMSKLQALHESLVLLAACDGSQPQYFMSLWVVRTFPQANLKEFVQKGKKMRLNCSLSQILLMILSLAIKWTRLGSCTKDKTQTLLLKYSTYNNEGINMPKITLACCDTMVSSALDTFLLLPIRDNKITCLWLFARIVPWPEMSHFPSPSDQLSPLLPVQVLLSTIVILSKLSPFTFLHPCNPSSTTS